LVDQLEAALSLKGCRTLKVKGEVTVENPTHAPMAVPPGIH